MLTTRSVIFSIVAVAVLSVVFAFVSLIWNGEKRSTLGKDSYGTFTEGYCAIHDLIEALGFETSRKLVPAIPRSSFDTSYILWHPRERYIQTEPAYLKELSQWVHQGGYLVVTPSSKTESSNKSVKHFSGNNRFPITPISLLNELGVEGVAIKEIALNTQTKYPSQKNNSNSESLRQTVQEILKVKSRPTASYAISCKGKWDHLQSQVRTIEIPVDQAWQIDTGELEAVAEITAVGWGDDGKSGILAAMFPMGEGYITIISNPFLASNIQLSEADNCVLLTHLVTGMRKKVVFDEFYHGLTVRGNVFWLLSKRPYAIITTSILVLVGVWAWRNAVFLGPSRGEAPDSRRTLAEYLEAMSRFLLKGRDSSKYILSEVRDGVLWHYSKVLGLPPQQHNLEVVLGLLSRRSPNKATQLEAAVKYADVVLKNPRARKKEILLATRKVSDCLST